MVDKQIIIDGVDVSGCPCIQSNNIGDVVCVRLARTSLYCKGQPCYYKALERKEQEVDILKAERDSYIDKYFLESQKVLSIREVLKEIKDVLQLYNNTTIGTDKGNGIFEFEVVNDNVLGGKLICYYDTNPAKKALQKISEVEDG